MRWPERAVTRRPTWRSAQVHTVAHLAQRVRSGCPRLFGPLNQVTLKLGAIGQQLGAALTDGLQGGVQYLSQLPLVLDATALSSTVLFPRGLVSQWVIDLS